MVGSTLTTHHDSQTSATIEREPVLMSITPSPANRATCHACKEGVAQPFPFSMAFQPIVDVRSGTPYAYEALVRGPKGEGANSILSQVNPENIYAFDQNCRVRAISLAARLNLPATGAALSINFMPGAVYSPSACIQLTLQTARQVDFPLDRLIFEVTEVEEIRDRPHLKTIVDAYRDLGFRIALDDFGAGHSGLNLLASFPPDILKLDMELTRDLPRRPAAIAILNAMVGLAKALNTELVAEGVETLDEYHALCDAGVHLMQGYLFARPAFEALPDITRPS
jgi:EAL domain-containing protein (putative c-di-GMP-specific phosphodiesterase class I)